MKKRNPIVFVMIISIVVIAGVSVLVSLLSKRGGTSNE